MRPHPAPAGRTASRKTLEPAVNILLIIIAVIAIIALITGGVAHAVSWLLYVGGILLVIAIIVFLLRVIGGRGRV